MAGSSSGRTRKERGRDKVTLILSPKIQSFGNWFEQLIAESTGKEGKRILPIVGEQLGRPEAYGDDRLFVSIQLDGDADGVNELALSKLSTGETP